MAKKIEIRNLALETLETPRRLQAQGAANQNRKGTGHEFEIEESNLELNIEKAADDLIDVMLRRAQQAEAAKRAGLAPFDRSNRRIAVSGPFSSVIEMVALEPINPAEANSIYSLLAFVSFNQNIKQERIQAVVEARFNVNHIEKIQRIDFQEAVDFLINLRMDKLN